MSVTENKWQKHYRNTILDGRKPTSKISKEQYEILGKLKDTVTVHFPEFYSTIESQCHPAMVKTFTITFDDMNVPENRLSVQGAAANLALWTDRGYRIDY